MKAMKNHPTDNPLHTLFNKLRSFCMKCVLSFFLCTKHQHYHLQTFQWSHWKWFKPRILCIPCSTSLEVSAWNVDWGFSCHPQMTSSLCFSVLFFLGDPPWWLLVYKHTPWCQSATFLHCHSTLVKENINNNNSMKRKLPDCSIGFADFIFDKFACGNVKEIHNRRNLKFPGKITFIVTETEREALAQEWSSSTKIRGRRTSV